MVTRDPQYEHQSQYGGAGYILFGLAIAAIPFFGALAMVTRLIGPAAIPIWFAAMGGVSYILTGAIGKAIARRIDGGELSSPAEVPPEVYAELDELRARVVELEERVDFSERLLTKKTGPES